jgi:molybdate transport system regulatory protein
MPRLARKPAPLPRHRVTLRFDLAHGGRIGPGKIALLEAIAETGSISAAGRKLKMSYRRAWDLVEALNQALGAAVVHTATGGAGGGGAQLTPLGARLIAVYRELERETDARALPRIEELLAAGRSTSG